MFAADSLDHIDALHIIAKGAGNGVRTPALREPTMLEFKVIGMTCGGCVNAVTTAIVRAVPGVTVDVDIEAGTVQVAGTHRTGLVVDAIEDAGFSVIV